MQPLKWYAYRLRAMSPGEVAGRMRSAMRDATDRYRLTLGHYRGRLVDDLVDLTLPDVPGFRVCDLPVGGWSKAEPDQPETRWCRTLLARADRIADHQLTFFDLVNCDLGHPIDWNRDHKSGRRAPMRFAPSIDYRDFDVTGDAKIVWEPNRHHHLVVLARAYRAGGDVRYARAVIEQLDRWIDACPFGIGMNWRSPLELAVRLINWVWAIDLIREAGVITDDFRRKLLQSVYLHLWEITRKYSNGSSTNNHLIGEAAGVFIASSYFCRFKEALHWQNQSREILCREIITQTWPDGAGREQAIGYHLFVLQFYLLVGIVARRIGQDLPKALWDRLEAMLTFAGTLSEGGDHLPNYGDCDDGYVLDLGSRHGDIRSLLAVGVALFDRSEFKTWAGEFSEPAYWLLGEAGRQRFIAIPKTAGRRIESHGFLHAGLYLLQYGCRDDADRISVTFDCGPQGLPPLAGHGHADALSFTLRAFGRDVFVDPGTYDYFSYPTWRRYFKSTRAHNTLEIDGQDQAVMLGSFMWSFQVNARCEQWNPGLSGGRVVGEHDGYGRLADSVLHRRALELDGLNRLLTVRDDLFCEGEHEVALMFHIAEHCRIVNEEACRFEIDVGPGCVILQIDPSLTVETLHGSTDPIVGWVSRAYHHKAETTTLIARTTIRGNTFFICTMDIYHRSSCE
jgi:hypothetical protein